MSCLNIICCLTAGGNGQWSPDRHLVPEWSKNAARGGRESDVNQSVQHSCHLCRRSGGREGKRTFPLTVTSCISNKEPVVRSK